MKPAKPRCRFSSLRSAALHTTTDEFTDRIDAAPNFESTRIEPSNRLDHKHLFLAVVVPHTVPVRHNNAVRLVLSMAAEKET